MKRQIKSNPEPKSLGFGLNAFKNDLFRNNFKMIAIKYDFARQGKALISDTILK